MVTRAFDLVLFGAPGAGKGTQARRLAAAFELSHLCTGDLLREEVERCTSLGEAARDFMNRGELVPDDVIKRVLFGRLHTQQASLGCVYDGVPRTTAQAELLDGLLAELNRRVDLVFNIHLPEVDLVARVTGRRSCPSCSAVYNTALMPPREAGVCDHCGARLIQREDDREDVSRERLRIHHERTAPLLDLYQRRGTLVEVDGRGQQDEVFGRLHEGIRRRAR
jgi:adenylate kinase